MNMPEDGFGWLVHRQWPAGVVEDAHGWLLRYAGGVTKRANSVLPRAEPGDIEAAIGAAERCYRERGLPVVFSLDAGARPFGLDTLLAARGYAEVDPTLIMTRPLDQRWTATAHRVVLAEGPSQEWLARWWATDGRGDPGPPEAARRIVCGVPSVYAAIGDGTPDAVGRVTVTDGWAGVYCMAVAPERRRAGLGRSVLAALLDAAAERGAHHAYLAVVAANAPARGLYSGMGFTVTDGYHYRVG